MSGWYIYDRKRVYINTPFAVQEEAKQELQALLRPYPQTHEWRRRLHVMFKESNNVEEKATEPASNEG